MSVLKMLREDYLPDWQNRGPKRDTVLALEFLAAKIDELENLKLEGQVFDGSDFRPVWVVWKDNRCPTCGRKKKKNG